MVVIAASKYFPRAWGLPVVSQPYFRESGFRGKLELTYLEAQRR